MSRHSLVSIIMIFLNTEKFLEEAIESVLAQSYEDWELLLVDDGSTDKSTKIARRYVDQYPKKIHYLEHPSHQNLGMSASRNLGARKAKGEYIAFLDADDLWLPEKLKTHVLILESHPEAGMLFGSCKYWFSWTGEPADSRRDYLPASRIGTQTLFPPPALLSLFLEGRTEIAATCSTLVRTAAFKRVGGFEETFRGMYEDQAFYAKICLAFPVLATGDCVAWYRQSPDSSTGVADRRGQMFQAREQYLNWLEGYLVKHSFQDQPLWQSVRREQWLLDSPAWLSKSRRLLSFWRWAKKWLLRADLVRFR